MENNNENNNNQNVTSNNESTNEFFSNTQENKPNDASIMHNDPNAQNMRNNEAIQKNSNPALGQRKMSNDLSSMPQDNETNQNPATNNADSNANMGSSNTKPENQSLGDGKKGLTKNENNIQENKPNNNPLPGAMPNGRNNNNNKPNTKSVDNSTKPKNKGEKEKFNPKRSINDLRPSALIRRAASRLGRTAQNNIDGETENEENGTGLTNVVRGLSGKLPVIIKFALPVLPVLLIIIVAAIFITAIIGGISGGAILSSTCDNPSYGVNSTDATSFLCTMSSPFGDENYEEGDEYQVTSTSGKRIPPQTSSGYGSSFHQGTDVVGFVGKYKENADIYAVADGVVVSAGPLGGWGNQVLIKHGDKFYTRYAHLSSIKSEILASGIDGTGEVSVKAGDKIGVMGNTGNSGGTHLHFEFLDEDMNYLSANPFFGYSDEKYEDCLSPNSDAANIYCDFSRSGTTRNVGQEGFKEICAKKGSYSNQSSCCGTKNNTGSSAAALMKFIQIFEGSGARCDASDGSEGYIVYADKLANNKLTVGPGVTSDYIDGMHVGDCLTESKVLEGYKNAEASKRKFIQETFKGADLSQQQEDAMVSMAYNGCGTFFDDIAKAAKKDDLAEVWKSMKGCTNNGLLGLERRRKAEFALYVTGDYSEETSQYYKNKTWTSAEYDDYDSDGILAKKTSGTSASKKYCDLTYYSPSDVVKAAQKELEHWQELSNTEKRKKVATEYMPACGYYKENTVDDYCAAFVSYILKITGNLDKVGAGVGNKCVAPDWKNSTGGTFHKVGSDYTPKPGDLAVYSGHVEIVEKVEGKMVTAISGNSGEMNVSDGGYPGKTVGNVVRKMPYGVDTTVVGYLEY